MLKFKSFIFNERYSFYLLLFLTVVGIFFTNPFLIYPYDVYTHLEWMYNQDITTPLDSARVAWHYSWENIFSLFHISKSQILLKAYIIHYTQVIAIFFAIFYTSKVVIRNIFIDILTIEINILAYWATLIWFSIFSTFSGYYHQVWILWYSVNYQITLPLALLTMALSISFILENKTKTVKFLQLLLIAFFSYVILKIHAMEYIYYLLYMSVLMLVYIDMIFKICKRYIYYAIPLFIGLLIVASQFIVYLKTSSYRVPPIFNYLSFDKMPELIKEIEARGSMLYFHYDRYGSSINELMVLVLALLAILLITILYRYIRGYRSIVHTRMVIFLLITSLFIAIPLTKVTGGIASLLTYTTVVHRFYYSSLLFLILPVFVFYIYTILKIRKIYLLHIVIATTLIATFYYSKHVSSWHNYYKNIISIKNSFSQDKVGFNLSKKEINTIGEKLKYYESIHKHKKPNYYYARGDIAMVLKFIYGKNVHYRKTFYYEKSYREHKDKKYYPILFEVPKEFPTFQFYK